MNSSPNSRPIYNWVLENKDHVRDLLTDLVPYLRVKQAQAYLMLEYLSIQPDYKFTPEQIDRRQNIFAEFTRLNTRGVA